MKAFLFTRFEGDTGGDETLLKLIVKNLTKNIEITDMDIFIRHDASSKNRADALNEKIIDCQIIGKIKVYQTSNKHKIYPDCIQWGIILWMPIANKGRQHAAFRHSVQLPTVFKHFSNIHCHVSKQR